MARSHHRKAHKAHLKTYQQSQGTLKEKNRKTRVTSIFTILGAALGLAIGFFASGSLIAMLAGFLAGAGIGYYIGRRMDMQTG